MSVSIQVIDNVYGNPAVALPVYITRVTADGWSAKADGQTNEHGLVSGLSESMAEARIYQLEFDLGRYFSSRGVEPFYSTVSVRIQIKNTFEPHRISVFITPHSCATYYHVNWNGEVQ